MPKTKKPSQKIEVSIYKDEIYPCWAITIEDIEYEKKHGCVVKISKEKFN